MLYLIVMNSLYRLFTEQVYYVGNCLDFESGAEKHRMSWNHELSNNSPDRENNSILQ